MHTLLKDKDFKAVLKTLASSKGLSYEEVKNEASGYLKELASAHEPFADMVSLELIQYIVGRGYDKTIDVRATELRELTKIMRRYPVAFVMTHKTYIDMFVLALVLARHGLPLPFTFAGINMDFFALGKLARQSGIVYIRRTITDNPVYRATLKHYIAHLLKEKSHFMWALEGTRSRTGKLLWPKLGILKYISDAEQVSDIEVKYVPVSITYDLIPDVAAMVNEGRGKEKSKESLAWFVKYIKNLGSNFGKISLRFGQPIAAKGKMDQKTLPEPNKPKAMSAISLFALELVHRINQITPVTTPSLICLALLSKYGLSRKRVEIDVADMMQLIESHKQDALVDRGLAIGQSVQKGVNLLTQAGIFVQRGESLNARYTIASDSYLQATYYANMAAHHFYHRAFTELALLKISNLPAEERSGVFWKDIMSMRALFKFEFFYSNKALFTEEVESDMSLLHPNWEEYLSSNEADIEQLISDQKILISPGILTNYIEAYRAVAQALQKWDVSQELEEKPFLEFCMSVGEELHWLGRIRRIEAVSKPFLLNGIRLVRHLKLIPTQEDPKSEAILAFIDKLEDIGTRLNDIQGIILSQEHEHEIVPAELLEREIVPGSKTETITNEILASERGPQVAAFFDLDRTLIKGFSAKEFVQTRLFSGKMTSKEMLAQLSGAIIYATGNKNFAGLAALGAKGVKGIKEKVFIELGEEVYYKHLADAIYEESRALVAAHVAMGHTVAIVSAATPYQVNPVARDLGIEHVLCTRMETKNGVFTGALVEPPCWGQGKAILAIGLADEHGVDMNKSYFYTDSAEDLPLLERVGKPVAVNPDNKLSSIAYRNDWPIYRFDDEHHSRMSNVMRTVLTAGSIVPAVATGVAMGARNWSWEDGINSMMASVGDMGTAMAGIRLVVKGQEHIEANRPAVFIMNHQSSADLLIAAKLIRKDARGIAKKELQSMPIIGQILLASGAIFIDRKNKDKAIEAMKPAVEALKNGISIIIFPEGTRSMDYSLGKFKKGAFHLAHEAGVPIVPIVLKNAHDAMPRGTSIFKPANIEVVVLPPVFTEDWELHELGERVNDVQNMYVKELDRPLVSQALTQ